MAEDVGGIVWTADINTQRLTRAERQIDRSAGRVERRFGGVENSADRARFAVRRMAAGISAALAVRQVTAYADAWTNVQNQLRVVTDSQEELAEVSERIVTIARETRASLEGTSQLYSRFRRGVDDTVASDEQLLGVTRTINQALAISGATAAEAEGALRQLAQGIASGTLRGEEFNSVSEQAPGILRAVSQETGMAVGALREFAAQGGITAELLITSLENYADTAEREFAGSTRSMSASLEVARTNAIEFVGATQSITKAVGAAGDGIIFLSENLDTLVQLAVAGVAVFGARFVGAMAAATAEHVRSAAASRANTLAKVGELKETTALVRAEEAKTVSATKAARASLQQAAATVRSTEAVLAQLQAERSLEAVRLKAQINDMGRAKTVARMAEIRRSEAAITAQLTTQKAALTRQEQALSAATTNQAVARNNATAAANRHAAAQSRASVAMTIAATAARGLRGAMAFLGGPAGVIFLAAAALTTWVMRADEAAERTGRLKIAVDGLVDSFENMDQATTVRQLETFEQQAKSARERIAEINAEIQRLQNPPGVGRSGGWMAQGARAGNAQAIAELREEAESLTDELEITSETAFELQKRLYGIRDGGDPFEVPTSGAEEFTEKASALRNVLDEVAWAQEKVRAGVGGNEDPFDIPEAPDAPDEPDPGTLGLTDLQALEEQYAKERQMLLDAQQAGIDSKVSYEQRLTELQRQYAEQRNEIMQGEKTGMIAALEEVGFSFDSLANRGVGALAQVATGMQDGEDAAKMFARTMLTDLIGALIRMGFQAVATTLMASGAEQAAKATSVATTGAAMAATAAATSAAAGVATAAWTTPAALASIATLGGAAAIGTAALGTSLAAAQGMAAASQATSAVANAAGSIGGGRLYGGPVNPGTMYPVTEDGRPEMLVQNGRQYLLPGARGEVISNREMTQHNGGDTIQVEQNFNVNERLDAQQFRNMVYDSNVGSAIYSVVQQQAAKRGKRL